jgi:hypothetical protein
VSEAFRGASEEVEDVVARMAGISLGSCLGCRESIVRGAALDACGGKWHPDCFKANTVEIHGCMCVCGTRLPCFD